LKRVLVLIKYWMITKVIFTLGKNEIRYIEE